MKPRRKMHPAPKTREESLDPREGAEYRHRKTGNRVRIIDVFFVRYRLWSYVSGRRSWISFETLFKGYRLIHKAVKAKVGTGPGTIVTLLQDYSPVVGDRVWFTTMLNGKPQGGLVDGVNQCGDETIYMIMRV